MPQDNIKDIQEKLVTLGYSLDKSTLKNGQLDGKLGPETKSAIRDFQKSQGLKDDGIWGPKTQKAFDNETINNMDFAITGDAEKNSSMFKSVIEDPNEDEIIEEVEKPSKKESKESSIKIDNTIPNPTIDAQPSSIGVPRDLREFEYKANKMQSEGTVIDFPSTPKLNNKEFKRSGLFIPNDKGNLNNDLTRLKGRGGANLAILDINKTIEASCTQSSGRCADYISEVGAYLSGSKNKTEWNNEVGWGNAWTKVNSIINHGGMILSNNGFSKDVEYKTGDVVELDRRDDNTEASKLARKYNSTEHIGIVVGVNKNGELLISHQIGSGKSVIQPLSELNTFGYTPKRVARVNNHVDNEVNTGNQDFFNFIDSLQYKEEIPKNKYGNENLPKYAYGYSGTNFIYNPQSILPVEEIKSTLNTKQQYHNAVNESLNQTKEELFNLDAKFESGKNYLNDINNSIKADIDGISNLDFSTKEGIDAAQGVIDKYKFDPNIKGILKDNLEYQSLETKIQTHKDTHGFISEENTYLADEQLEDYKRSGEIGKFKPAEIIEHIDVHTRIQEVMVAHGGKISGNSFGIPGDIVYDPVTGILSYDSFGNKGEVTYEQSQEILEYMMETDPELKKAVKNNIDYQNYKFEKKIGTYLPPSIKESLSPEEIEAVNQGTIGFKQNAVEGFISNVTQDLEKLRRIETINANRLAVLRSKAPTQEVTSEISRLEIEHSKNKVKMDELQQDLEPLKDPEQLAGRPEESFNYLSESIYKKKILSSQRNARSYTSPESKRNVLSAGLNSGRGGGTPKKITPTDTNVMRMYANGYLPSSNLQNDDPYLSITQIEKERSSLKEQHNTTDAISKQLSEEHERLQNLINNYENARKKAKTEEELGELEEMFEYNKNIHLNSISSLSTKLQNGIDVLNAKTIRMSQLKFQRKALYNRLLADKNVDFSAFDEMGINVSNKESEGITSYWGILGNLGLDVEKNYKMKLEKLYDEGVIGINPKDPNEVREVLLNIFAGDTEKEALKVNEDLISDENLKMIGNFKEQTKLTNKVIEQFTKDNEEAMIREYGDLRSKRPIKTMKVFDLDKSSELNKFVETTLFNLDDLEFTMVEDGPGRTTITNNIKSKIKKAQNDNSISGDLVLGYDPNGLLPTLRVGFDHSSDDDVHLEFTKGENAEAVVATMFNTFNYNTIVSKNTKTPEDFTKTIQEGFIALAGITEFTTDEGSFTGNEYAKKHLMGVLAKNDHRLPKITTKMGITYKIIKREGVFQLASANEKGEMIIRDLLDENNKSTGSPLVFHNHRDVFAFIALEEAAKTKDPFYNGINYESALEDIEQGKEIDQAKLRAASNIILN